MADDILELSKKASEMILSMPKATRIRVVSHYDADGITSAGIICTALHRAGYDFHATLMRNPFTQGLERVKQEENEMIIFSDMGSGQIETMEKFGCKVIIIDHHQYLKSKPDSNDVLQINANLCGIDGNYEACGATLSFSVAKALDFGNVDLAPLAIAGAIGDKQYIGGIKGYNKTILDEALKNGYLKQSTGIKLNGKSLADGLYYSIDPYHTGLSGDNEGISKLLEKLHLEKNTKIEDLDDNKKRQLQSILLFKLIKKGCEKNIIDTVIRERYWSDLLQCELERFADLLDACGKGGNRGLGLAICLNDKKAFDEAIKLEKEYKQKILDELLQLEKDGAKEKKSIRFFHSNDSSLGGVVGGIAMNYIFDKEKPLISLTRKNDELHVSSRGNQYLVNNGLDLGSAMKEAAAPLNGHGGGHKIAAGATIALEKEEEFLVTVDKIITQQMKGGKP
jgi:single-stranded-DNA-specific exonuclease